jgi:hypothetical protein
MSDLRPDDSDDTNLSGFAERTGMPPELLPLHHRLTDDGERWRRRAPDGAGLGDRARATLAESADATRSRDDARRAPRQPRLRQRLLEPLDSEHTAQIPGPKGPMLDMKLKMNRIRGFVGAAAAVLVVGLIALVLTQGLAHRTGPGATAAATATPHATPLTTETQNSLQPQDLPIVAQSDPTVVYMLASGALQRSSDGGKTYSSEALPKTDLSSIDTMSIAVSPLDASHVFLMASGTKDGQGCNPPNGPYPTIATHGGVMASGYIPCVDQFVSADGGQTWSQPNLPTKGVLGGFNLLRAVQGAYGTPAYTFQAQGQRLYSAMAFDNQSGSLVDSPGARLVASDDGGMTWSFVDTTLAASNRYICDVGVSPIPSVIYAVTGDQACGGMGNYANLSLWRSDNGGQSWSRVRSMPTLAESGLFVGSHGELYTYTPQVTVQGHGASTSNSPTDAVVSVDSGMTFLSAPTAGLPSDANLFGPYATLADGSIVFGEYGPQPVEGPNTLYSWSKGQSSWTKIAVVPAGIGSVTAAPAAAGAAQQTLSIVGLDGKVQTVKVTLGQ